MRHEEEGVKHPGWHPSWLKYRVTTLRRVGWKKAPWNQCLLFLSSFFNAAVGMLKTISVLWLPDAPWLRQTNWLRLSSEGGIPDKPGLLGFLLLPFPSFPSASFVGRRTNRIIKLKAICGKSPLQQVVRELHGLNISNSYHLLRINIQDTKLNSRGLSMLMIQNNS